MKAPGIHCYVAGSIPTVTLYKKIEKCSLEHKKKGKKKELLLALLSFSKYVMRVAFYWPNGPRRAASAVAHLSGSRTVPWPLVFETLGLR
jgi:hypothetical protein